MVKYQEWEALNILNKEMTRKLKEDIQRGEAAAYEGKDSKLPPYIGDPISAFVSMETEEAYNFLATKDPPSIKIGEEESEIREALEPTNILWENYDMDLLRQAA